jgi:hypothetical protein
MSTVKTNNLQIGQSLTASQNFSWYQPSSPDGTVRLGVGNAGATTSDVIVANSSGNVGIGTSSPATKLQVSGAGSTPVTFERTGSNGVYLQLKDASGSSVFLGASNGVFAIQTPGSSYSDKLLIDSSGNLGLGVTPSGWDTSTFKALQIATGLTLAAQPATNSAKIGANWYFNSDYKYTITGAACRYDMDGNVFKWFNASSGSAGGTISFTQAMTLDASGNLNVGCTSTPSAGQSGMQYQPNGALVLARATTSTVAAIYFINNNGTVGQINTGGTSTTYVTTSDQRLKTNVEPSGSAIESILNFPVDQFDWIADGSHQDFGAVAQKVKPIIPEMVTVPEDPEAMWGIDWSKAVPRLIRTIQELSAQVTTLQAEINALKA